MNGLPTGAPIEACGDVTDIVPNHEPFNESSDDDIPYYVDLYYFWYYNNETYTYIPGYYYSCK